MVIDNPKEVTEKKILPYIKECFKDNLKSVVLYGSAASASFNAASSDINILILINKNNTDSFVEFGKKSKKIDKKYRFSILILTFEEFINSADVFPMEYYDICDRHIVIHGDSIEGKLKLTSNNLRHQLEERLRGFSNLFRQAIIESAGNLKFLKQSVLIVPGVVKSLLRPALRLKKAEVKNLTDTMLFKKVQQEYNVDMSVFLTDFNAVKNKDIVSVITKILEAIEKITMQIDAAGNR